MTHVDTDRIIPKNYLKTIKRTGLGKALFAEMRYDASGREDPEFVLNKAPFRKATIIVAGENFGCGSSREHAPWALLDFGIRCVIAPSFADIFFNNTFKNGILPITLPEARVNELIRFLLELPGAEMTIDLPAQTVLGPDARSTSSTSTPSASTAWSTAWMTSASPCSRRPPSRPSRSGRRPSTLGCRHCGRARDGCAPSGMATPAH